MGAEASSALSDGLSLGQRILLELETPTSPSRIASRLDLPLAVVTSLLCRLVRQGEAVRIGYGSYVGAAHATGIPLGDGGRTRPVRDALLATIDREWSVEQLARTTASSTPALRRHLNALVKQGRLERVGADGYRPPQPVLPGLFDC